MGKSADLSFHIINIDCEHSWVLGYSSCSDCFSSYKNRWNTVVSDSLSRGLWGGCDPDSSGVGMTTMPGSYSKSRVPEAGKLSEFYRRGLGAGASWVLRHRAAAADD